jgi:preprotein translocase subunit SecD
VKPASLWASLLLTLSVAVGLLAYLAGGGSTPVLGLDLQGGVSVILSPTEPASEDDLIVIRDLIRDELESRGIAEPDVRVEGANLVVDLPGVRDQRDALEAVDVAGIVTLRPVVLCGFAPGAPTDELGPGQDILSRRDGIDQCLVNPSGGTGEVFAQGSATPTLEPPPVGWGVSVDLRSDGAVIWNALAQQCFNGTSECPTRQLAIVLDDVIQSAPTVNAPSFAGAVSITGSFTEEEARGLARVLNRGAFPVGVEAQSVETVSPALGGDTLRAVIVSGLVAAVLIVALMLLYYRRIAVVAVAGLVVWAMSMYSATVLVSQATNYALSLAGATGIIVAIGIAVDSYVVLFERLNDEIRSGRLLRNAVGRSFDRSWRTIVSANVMSILAAVILFTLSVGSVKGFALYLGLTTVVNLLVYFTFAKPMVMLLSRASWFAPTTAVERALTEQVSS